MDQSDQPSMNSRQWWEDYFAGAWDANNGRAQTRYFMRQLVKNLPAAEREYLASREASILDWGCALGDGVGVLAEEFKRCKAAGLDFAERAVAEARRSFPENFFLHSENGSVGERYDVITCSHCLEHFTDPLAVLREHLRFCRCFYALLVPYCEQPLIESHFTRFDEDSFPEHFEGFTRVAVEVIDSDPAHWAGKMMLVVYASASYLRERKELDMQIGERKKWDDYYAALDPRPMDETVREFGEELAAEIFKFLPPESSVLEAGCGAGWQSMILSQTGKLDVTLMDFSPEALRHAERSFEQQGLSARYMCQNVFVPGEEEFDLVFNAGVLEHYTLDEQAAFLRGMASRSRKYVLALVPNPNCYWYWIWRIYNSARGNWPYGKEVPLSGMSAAFEAAGLTYLGEWFGGSSWSEDFIATLPDMNDQLRNHILSVHRSGIIPMRQRAYLVAALGCKGEAPAMPNGWHTATSPRDFATDQLTAALADSLSATVAGEHRCQTLALSITEKDRLITAGEEKTAALQRELQEKTVEIARLNNKISNRPLSRLRPQRIWSSARRHLAIRTRLRRAARRIAPEGTSRGRYVRAAVEKIRRIRRGPAEQTGLSLEQILSETEQRRGIVVYPPFIDWGWMRQRPHQLMSEFAKAGFLSLFCSPQRHTDRFQGFVKVEERLYLCDDPKSLHHLPNCLLLVGWSGWEQVKHFDQPAVIYDYLDDLGVAESWASQEYKTSLHRKLVSTSRVVLATARRLHDEVKQQRPDALYCPNGVDYDHFHLTSRPNPPDDIADLVAAGRTIVGYYGALAQWFDYELVARAAALRKDWTFLLIGPDFDDSLSAHNLQGIPNIRWLGEKRYEELPAYLHHFSAATIPFKINDITRATSPVKLFEYMAANKPIVTTDMPECRAQPCVMVARDADEFAATIEEAIRRGATDSYRREVDEAARANTWKARVEQIVDQLDAIKAKERLQSA